MHCDICSKKKATVHLTEIIDEQMTELHLCEDCAREKSVQMEQQFGLADLLAGLVDFGKQTKPEEKQVVECPNCGMNYEDFRKFGRLGCGECYVSFGNHLDVLLKKIHGSNQHLGKGPISVAVKAKVRKETKKKTTALPDLKEQLHNAISVEDFEKAAELRDKIRESEKKGKKK